MRLSWRAPGALTVNVNAASLFSGLLYRSATLAAAAIVVSFTVTSLLIHVQSSAEILKSVCVLSATGLVTGIVMPRYGTISARKVHRIGDSL
jgi:hypothetical protein